MINVVEQIVSFKKIAGELLSAHLRNPRSGKNEVGGREAMQALQKHLAQADRSCPLLRAKAHCRRA
jgi:hypothetical protein